MEFNNSSEKAYAGLDLLHLIAHDYCNENEHTEKFNNVSKKEIKDFLGEFMSSIEIQGKRVYFRVPQKSRDEGLPIWQKISKNSKSYYSLNRSHPLINKFLAESRNNIEYLKLFENTIPYHDIFNLISSGKEDVVTWQEDIDKNLKSIKELITFLKASKLSNEKILIQIQEIIKLSEMNMTKLEIEEML